MYEQSLSSDMFREVGNDIIELDEEKVGNGIIDWAWLDVSRVYSLSTIWRRWLRLS